MPFQKAKSGEPYGNGTPQIIREIPDAATEAHIMKLTGTSTDAEAPVNSLFRSSDNAGALCWKSEDETVTVIAP